MVYPATRSSKNAAAKYLTAEQLEAILGAISEGKYSWASVLILRFTGYNPLHYIPYRTYNRLEKAHCLRPRRKLNAVKVSASTEFAASCKPDAKIRNLDYVEPIDAKAAKIEGGTDFAAAYYSLSSDRQFLPSY